MSNLFKPGPSMIRHTIDVLTEKGAVVVPRDWDAEYVVTEINVWLRTAGMRGQLIEHGSLSPEGLVGVRSKLILLHKNVPEMSSGRERKRR